MRTIATLGRGFDDLTGVRSSGFWLGCAETVENGPSYRISNKKTKGTTVFFFSFLSRVLGILSFSASSAPHRPNPLDRTLARSSSPSPDFCLKVLRVSFCFIVWFRTSRNRCLFV